MKANDLTDILAECLESIERGERTKAECLALYPEHQEELQTLLPLAAVALVVLLLLIISWAVPVRLWIEAVNLVEVDVVHPQPREAGVDPGEDHLARQPGGVGPGRFPVACR